MRENDDLLIKGAISMGIDLNDFQINLFEKYLSEIKDWNKKINITAVEDDCEIVKKHFLDSMAGIRFFDTQEKPKIADIGTGAGLPGIPVKIVKQNTDITFVDSSTKKISIVKNMCQSLGLLGCSYLSDNIEKLGKSPEYRDYFDIVLSRALAPLNVLLEYGIPLLKINGKMIVYKGPSVNEEVENSCHALEELNARITEKAYFILPFTDYKRTVLVVEKMGKTPDKYPRNIGIPRKRPL